MLCVTQKMPKPLMVFLIIRNALFIWDKLFPITFLQCIGSVVKILLVAPNS